MAFIETEILIFTKKNLLEKYSYDNFSILKKEGAIFGNPYFSSYLETQNFYLVASNKFKNDDEYLNSEERWEELCGEVVVDVIFSDGIDYDKKWVEEIPNYLKSGTEYESFGILRIEKKYRKNLELMLKNMIEISEIKTIIFSSQYENNEKNLILGIIKLDVFLEKLFSKEILANTHYIVSK